MGESLGTLVNVRSVGLWGRMGGWLSRHAWGERCMGGLLSESRVDA